MITESYISIVHRFYFSIIMKSHKSIGFIFYNEWKATTVVSLSMTTEELQRYTGSDFCIDENLHNFK